MPHWNGLTLAVVTLSVTAMHTQALTSTQTTTIPDAAVVVGIPVNYDEFKVGTYTLADPLLTSDGKKVTDPKVWWSKRRPEIESMLETQQYGVAPERPKDESFEVTHKGTPALNGKAIRKQITIHLSNDPAAHEIHLVEYLPAKATRPVPMYFDINFGVTRQARPRDRRVARRKHADLHKRPQLLHA